MKPLFLRALLAAVAAIFPHYVYATPPQITPGHLFVTAGHYIQEFTGQTGAFVGNVTTTNGINGSGNTELHFGPDSNLYGLGANGWVYKYDFSSGLKSTFAQPSGDLGATGLALGPDLNWYVAAGHFIQEFNGQTGAFIRNVTTTNGISGSSNTELHFGPDNNLYGIGSNSWVYKYDFTSGLKSTFAQPSGDLGATGLALGPDLNWYVAAGHFIQEFNGQTGAFIGNVTNTWNDGSSNTELQFGLDNNLYGLESNGWVYKYDFTNQQTSIFIQPTGDGGSTGLAISPVPEPISFWLALFGVAGLIVFRRYASWSRTRAHSAIEFTTVLNMLPWRIADRDVLIDNFRVNRASIAVNVWGNQSGGMRSNYV